MNKLLLERKISQLNSLREYKKFLSQFPTIKNPSKEVEIGQLYSCDDYDFSLDHPQEVVNRFDKMPLQLVFNKDSTHYWAISLHSVPVLHRASLLKKIQNTNPKQFKNGRFQNSKIRISYTILSALYRRCPDVTRCYKFDRVQNLRRITLDKWNEVSQFSPNTFVNSSLSDILKNR